MAFDDLSIAQVALAYEGSAMDRGSWRRQRTGVADHLMQAVAAGALALVVTACAGSSASGDTSNGGAADQNDEGQVALDAAPDDDAVLAIEEFADIASWWYSSADVSTTLCGEPLADGTLRIYRATDETNQGGLFCEGGGGSILNLQAAREIEQPDEDGVIQVSSGDIGTVTDGGNPFGKSQVGTVTVEIRSEAMSDVEPIVLQAEMMATSADVRFSFAVAAQSADSTNGDADDAAGAGSSSTASNDSSLLQGGVAVPTEQVL